MGVLSVKLVVITVPFGGLLRSAERFMSFHEEAIVIVEHCRK
jgi:hypothetical protein